MRRFPILLAATVSLTLALPPACSNKGGSDGGSGICGSSNSTCLDSNDCCTGFECAGGMCVFVGGNGGNNGGNNGSSGSGASSGGSSSVSSASGSASGHASSGNNSGSGSSGQGNSSGFGSTGQSSNSGGGSSGATSGYSPDLCSICKSNGKSCTGPSDICVCDPSESGCTTGYCAGSCGTGEQALCPVGTDCLPTPPYGGSGEDYVCFPSSLTCVGGASSSGGGNSGSGSGGGSSGGSSGGSGSGLCSICDSINCPGAEVCGCDPDDPSCNDGYCAPSCDVADAGDQALCAKGTTCVPTTDYATESLQYFVCLPSGGTCLDGG